MAVIFGLNNRIDSAAVTSSAAFAAGLPLAHLKSYLLPVVARTATADTFTLSIDLSAAPARNVGCVAVANHNLSRAAVVSIELFQGGASKVAALGLSPWPYLAADDPHFAVRNYAPALIDAGRMAAHTPTMIWFAPANQVANRAVITISDETNADGHIQIGRVFIGEQLALGVAEDYGDAAWGLKDISELSTGKSGVRFAVDHPRLRTVAVSLKHLSRSEAIGGLYAAQRAAGAVGEVIIAPETPAWADVGGVSAVDSHWFSRAIMGNFATLDRLTNPYLGAFGTTLDIEEVAR